MLPRKPAGNNPVCLQPSHAQTHAAAGSRAGTRLAARRCELPTRPGPARREPPTGVPLVRGIGSSASGGRSTSCASVGFAGGEQRSTRCSRRGPVEWRGPRRYYEPGQLWLRCRRQADIGLQSRALFEDDRAQAGVSTHAAVSGACNPPRCARHDTVADLSNASRTTSTPPTRPCRVDAFVLHQHSKVLLDSCQHVPEEELRQSSRVL